MIMREMSLHSVGWLTGRGYMLIKWLTLYRISFRSFSAMTNWLILRHLVHRSPLAMSSGCRSYAERFSFVSRKVFTCEASGKSGLTYGAALASEITEAQIVRDRFPDQLKKRVLTTVQFYTSRLDTMIEAVYERYKDRYFLGERVFVEDDGDK